MFVAFVIGWLKFARWYVSPPRMINEDHEEESSSPKPRWFPKLQKRSVKRQRLQPRTERDMFKLSRPRPNWQVIQGGKK